VNNQSHFEPAGRVKSPSRAAARRGDPPGETAEGKRHDAIGLASVPDSSRPKMEVEGAAAAEQSKRVYVDIFDILQ
jgi:hypothetical protein